MANKSHNYDYAVDVESDTAAAKVIKFVGNHKNVLEIGCGPGSITKILRDKNHCSITGIEYDPKAISLVAPYCDRIIEADLNKVNWADIASEMGRFETIVAADVLEHLYNPWKVLSSLKNLLVEDGEIIISLPHVGHAAIAACIMSGSFQYQDWGLLDRTHIRFFGLKDIDNLFNEAGLAIIDIGFVITPPEETEFAETWKTLNSLEKKTLISPLHSQVYQVVVKACIRTSQTVDMSVVEALKFSKSLPKRRASRKAQLANIFTDKQKMFIKRLVNKNH
jgi:2-polyprenyl-3-methyl-5-hydroxy-6-metoxy-1,4-benzoquinol methylase